MPRYYFHVQDGFGTLVDPEGREFPDRQSAIAAAIAGARSLICADVLEGRIDLSGQLEITGEDGVIVSVITFEEAAGAGRATGG